MSIKFNFYNCYLKLKENQKVIGYLYVGTASGKQKKIPEMETSEFVTQWI